MVKILLVEDDTPLMRLYQGALEVEYDVVAVESSSEAIDALNKFQPDLVVLDLNLPDAPGTVVLEYIEKHPEFENLKVVVMTGFAHHRHHNLPPRVVEMLSKPVTSSMLLRSIKTVSVNH
jgi:CheY-like chemotaxis protein